LKEISRLTEWNQEQAAQFRSLGEARGGLEERSEAATETIDALRASLAQKEELLGERDKEVARLNDMIRSTELIIQLSELKDHLKDPATGTDAQFSSSRSSAYADMPANIGLSSLDKMPEALGGTSAGPRRAAPLLEALDYASPQDGRCGEGQPARVGPRTTRCGRRRW
jgi:hypothetical protein